MAADTVVTVQIDLISEAASKELVAFENRIRSFKNNVSKGFRGAGTAAKQTTKDIKGMSKALVDPRGGVASKKTAAMVVRTADRIVDIGTNAKVAKKHTGGLGKSLHRYMFYAMAVGMVGAAFKKLMDSGAEYSMVLAEISTLTDESAFASEKQRMIVEGLASAYGVLRSEVGKGLYQTISAGIDDATGSQKLLTEAVGLSIGGLTSVNTSVDILTSALNSFGAENLSAARSADILFETVRLGKTTMEQLASAEGKILPLARELGVTFEEVNAAVVAMTKQGAKPSEAMTRLRSIFTAMIKKSGDFKKVFSEIGLVYDENTVKNRGFIQTLEDTRRALNGQRDRFTKLFGRIEATTGALALTTDQSRLYKDALDGIAGSAGAAGLALDEMRASSGRAWSEFKADISNAFTGFGEGFVDVFNAMFLDSSPLDDVSERLLKVAEAAKKARDAYIEMQITLGISSEDLDKVKLLSGRMQELGFSTDDASVKINKTTGELKLLFDLVDRAPASDEIGKAGFRFAEVTGTKWLYDKLQELRPEDEQLDPIDVSISFKGIADTEGFADDIVRLQKEAIGEVVKRVAKTDGGVDVLLPFQFKADDLALEDELGKIQLIATAGLAKYYEIFTRTPTADGSMFMDKFVVTMEDGTKKIVSSFEKTYDALSQRFEFTPILEDIKVAVDDVAKEYGRLDDIRSISLGGGVKTKVPGESGSFDVSGLVDGLKLQKMIADEVERTGINMLEVDTMVLDGVVRREALATVVTQAAAQSIKDGKALIKSEEERLSIVELRNREELNPKLKKRREQGIAAQRAVLKEQLAYLGGLRSEEAALLRIQIIQDNLAKARAYLDDGSKSLFGKAAESLLIAAREAVKTAKEVMWSEAEKRITDEIKAQVILTEARRQGLEGVAAELAKEDRRFDEFVDKALKLESLTEDRRMELVRILNVMRESAKASVELEDSTKRRLDLEKEATEWLDQSVRARMTMAENIDMMNAALKDGMIVTLQQELTSIDQAVARRKDQLLLEERSGVLVRGELEEELRLIEQLAAMDRKRAIIRAGEGKFGESIAFGVEQATNGMNTVGDLGLMIGAQFDSVAGQFASQMVSNTVSWSSFKDTVLRGLLELIAKWAILRAVSSFGFGSGGGTPGMGGDLNIPMELNAGGFAKGGVMQGSMVGFSSLPVNAYANGGIANTPQLAVFGEGRGAEAFVPLPDGRSIPVDAGGIFNQLAAQMRSMMSMMSMGGGQSSGGATINLSVDARGAADAGGVELAVDRALAKSMPMIQRAVGDSMMNGSSGRLTRGVRFAAGRR